MVPWGLVLVEQPELVSSVSLVTGADDYLLQQILESHSKSGSVIVSPAAVQWRVRLELRERPSRPYCCQVVLLVLP